MNRYPHALNKVRQEAVVRMVRRILHSPGPWWPGGLGPGPSKKRGVLGGDVERIEAELNGLVERRAAQTAEQRRVEDLWAQSVRRDRERRREENRAAWHSFHRHMQELHATLSEEHRTKAEGLIVAGGEP